MFVQTTTTVGSATSGEVHFELYLNSSFIFALHFSSSNQTLQSHDFHSQPLHQLENPLYVLSSSPGRSTHFPACTHTLPLNQ